MERLEVILPGVPRGVVVRPQPNAGTQTLVFLKDGIHPLEGGQGDCPFMLGPKLKLKDGATGGKYAFNPDNYKIPVCDLATKCVYFNDGYSVVQLDASNTIKLVAGHKDVKAHADGVGSEARLHTTYFQTTDGQGSLYVSEGTCIRKIKMPKDVGDPATVSTVASSAVKLTKLAYNTSSNQLLAASVTALYQVPLPPDTLQLSTSWGAATSSTTAPLLLVGQEDVAGSHDGIGATARFTDIRGLMAAPGGRSVYILDDGRLRKMDLATRSVTTLTTLMTTFGQVGQLALLPQGCLAVSIPHEDNKKLHILKAAEFAQRCIGTGAAPSSPTRPRRKLVDLLAQAPSGGPAIVNIRVGDRVYPAHRAVLADRSPYFERLLEGSVTEGGAAEVELQDTDPDTFAALLDCMYTGVLRVTEPKVLHGTAELAGRLLLEEVSAQLQERLLAAATPATVITDLMWAERHNLQLLATGLKRRAVCEFRRVAAATPLEEFKRLTVECPEVAAETMKKVGSQR